ncbi:MAG: hypothetical protein JSS95_03180 [Acidobacteria bacterium]|nr:hypothetical protein [Acidobacteriota bacterium]
MTIPADFLHRHIPHLFLPRLNAPFDSNDNWFLFFLTFAALLGTLSIARRLARDIGKSEGFEWLALGMAYAAYFDTILVLNRNLFYPYDLTALFFFTALSYLAYRGRALAFALVLVPAMINKETAAMAIFLCFGLHVRRTNLVKILATCTALGFEVIAIRLGQSFYLNSLCPGCAGPPEYHMGMNLRQMANPLFWAALPGVFGFAWVAALIFWRYATLRTRRTVAGLFAVWFVVMMVTGIIREIRIFSELSAPLLIVVAEGLSGWMAQKKTERVEISTL